MRRNLKTVDVALMRGMVTNISDVDLAQGAALRLASNVDYDVKFRTVSKMCGAEQKSPALSNPISSLNYYEYVDLNGVRQRQVMALEGGEFRQIDGLVLALSKGSGFTNEPLSSTTFNDLMLLASENNDPKKYDGNAVSKWGVNAPGSDVTERVTFDATTGWTATNGTVAAETVFKYRGAASLRVTKTSVVAQTAYITNTGLTLNLSGGSGYAYILVYIPRDTYSVMDTSLLNGCLSVSIGDAGFANGSSWIFRRGQVLPGWNLLAMNLAAPSSTTGGGAPLAAVTDMLVSFRTALAASTGAVFWDYFYTTSNGQCSAAAGAAGTLTGTFHYKVTFLTQYGVESNAGPASGAVVLAAQQGSVSAIPTSADSQVIARRLYRDANDGVYKFVTQINDNATTTYTDNTAVLSSVTPPEAASVTNDASPPERMLCCIQWRNHIFGINADRQIELNISDAGLPETFPIVSRLTFQDSLTALAVHPDGLLAFSTDRTYLITGYGTSDDPFVATEVNAEIGANHWQSVASYKVGVIVNHEDRVYMMEDTKDPWLVNGPVLGDHTIPAWRKSIVINDRVRNRAMVWLPNTPTGTSYQKAYVLNYAALGVSQVSPDGPGIDPMDPRTGIWSVISNPIVAISSICVIENSDEEPELWVGQDDGYVCALATRDETTGYQWFNNGANQSITASLGFFIPLHEQPGGRGTLRYLEVDAVGETNAAWSTTINYYDSPMRTTSLGSVSLTIDGTKSTVNPIPMGSRGAYAYVVMNNTANAASTIHRIRAHVVPRLWPRGQRS